MAEYKTIWQVQTAMSHYEPGDPRYKELEENLARIRARYAKRRLEPGRNLQVQKSIDSRKRKIQRKKQTIDYWESLRHTNPRYFDKLIHDAKLAIGQWEREIERLKKRK